MSPTLIIKIIGGVYGSLVGAYIYNLIYNKHHNNSNILNPDLKVYKPLTEYIFENQFKEYIDNNDKYNYEYDNEHGNTVELKGSYLSSQYSNEKPYIDYFSLSFSDDLERKND